MSVNHVHLIGNLGGDPELRHTQSGQAVGNFSVATSERWTTGDGERHEETSWHRIVVWGKTAEQCAQYLSKGREIYLEGRIGYRDWEDKDGNKRTTTEITARNVQFLGGPKDAEAPAPTPTPAAAPPANDDIPF